MKRVVLIVAMLALVLPAQAFAHATLEKTTPGFRARLPSSPPKIVLRFDQYVQQLPGSVHLYSSTGSVALNEPWSTGVT